MNTIAFKMWKLKIKEFRVKEQEYSNFRAGLYNVVLGQCTEALQNKLKSHTNFPNAYQDGIALLMIIEMLTFTFEECPKLSDMLCEIKEMFYSLRQGKHTSLQRYHELFLGQVKLLEEVGVTIPNKSLVKLITTANGRAGAPDEADWTAARKQVLAIQFIRGANDSHKTYLTHLWNSFLDGTDYYPFTLHEAYNILQRREPEGGLTNIVDADRVAFVNAGGERGEPRNLDHIICFDCGERRHYANNCPNRNQGEQGGTNLCTCGTEEAADGIGGFSFSQSGAEDIPASWMLLDNQSTVDLFCNRKLLVNLRPSSTRMNVRCNGGQRTTTMVGDLPGYGTVWYNPKSITNILSLKRVAEKYHVAFDSKGGGSFIVTKPDGTVFELKQSPGGLYFLDRNHKETVLVNTVANNKTNYTNQDYLKAMQARQLQIMIGRPSMKHFIKIVTSNQLPNCPVTRADILAAEHILRLDVGSLKGKTVWHQPHLAKPIIEPLPPQIMSRYCRVTLAAGVMYYVNGIPMLVTVSRNVCLLRHCRGVIQPQYQDACQCDQECCHGIQAGQFYHHHNPHGRGI
jgi:hypothetical protein